MWATGRLARERGDKVEALLWLRQAAEAGDPQARIDLTVWLVVLGEVQEAEHWAWIAGEGPDPRAVYHAGATLEALGKTADSERLYQKSAVDCTAPEWTHGR